MTTTALPRSPAPLWLFLLPMAAIMAVAVGFLPPLVTVGGVVWMSFAAVVAARPETGVGVILALLPVLPFVVLPVDLTGPLITPTRVLLSALYVGACVAALRGELHIRRSRVGWAMIVWIAAAALSLSTSIHPVDTILRIGSDVVEAFGVLLLTFVTYRRTSWRIPVYSLVAAYILNLVLAGFQFFIGELPWVTASSEPFISVAAERLGLPRIQGSFQHPAYLGTFLATTLPIVYVLATRSIGWRRAVLFGWFVIGLAGLVLSGTRAAWLGGTLALAAAYGAAVHMRPGRWRQAAVAVVVVVAAAVAVPRIASGIAGLVGDLTSTRSVAETATTGYRIELARAAVLRVSEHPWTGFGAGNFASAGVRGVFVGRTLHFTSPDNHLVRVLVETGYIGLAAFGLMMCAFAARAVSVVREPRPSDDRLLLFTVLSGLGCFLVVNLTISAFAVTQLAFVFWIFLGAVLAAGRRHDRG